MKHYDMSKAKKGEREGRLSCRKDGLDVRDESPRVGDVAQLGGCESGHVRGGMGC